MTSLRYTVHGDHVEHPDGMVSAVVATAELDIGAMEAARQRTALTAFTRLCHTLSTPVQFVIRVRRVTDVRDACDGEGRALALNVALNAHWMRTLRERPAFTRTVLAATRADSLSALDVSLSTLTRALEGVGVGARRLRGAKLVDAVRAGMPFERARWFEHPRFISAGATLVSSLALCRLPSTPVNSGWLAPVLRLRTDCDVAIHLSPAPLGVTLGRLGRRLRDLSAHRMLQAERGRVADVHVDLALDAAAALRERLARNAGQALHLSVAVTVRAESHDDLRRGCDAARVAFSAALAAAEPAHFRQLSGLVSTLPLGVDVLGSGKLVESAAAATCIPWADAPCVDDGGYRIGCAVDSGVPVRFAPFDALHHVNANVGVFAGSGQGKSFALGCLVLEAATHGVDSVIIDPEGEYRGIVTALGGAYLALAPGRGAAINIFDSGGDEDEAIAGVVALVSVLCGERLDDVERALVDAAARDAISHAAFQGRVAVLGDCLPALERSAPRVAVVVRRHCTGALGALFNQPTTIAASDGVRAISLRDVPDEHVAATALVVGRWLWQMVRNRPRRRHIVFDEVGALCAHPALRSLLVQLARRCRKYDASLVVATQNVSDLLSSDEGTVVATNCATLLLGGHRAAETALMERAFALTEAQRRHLESAGRGDFLLIAGDRRLPIRVEMPALHQAIVTAGKPAHTP